VDRNRMFDRNLTLAFQLADAIVDDPALLEKIPEGATVIFLPDDDPELATANRAMGPAALDRGEDVYFRHVRHVAHAAAPRYSVFQRDRLPDDVPGAIHRAPTRDAARLCGQGHCTWL